MLLQEHGEILQMYYKKVLIPSNSYFQILFIHFREKGKEGGRGEERERNISLMFYLLTHSLVASCVCPDRRLNPQPWHIN